MPSLLTCAEMHADHIVSSGSPHNNVLHFSSIIIDIRDYANVYVVSNIYNIIRMYASSRARGGGMRGARKPNHVITSTNGVASLITAAVLYRKVDRLQKHE